MVLWPYVWSLSIFRYTNIPLNNGLGFTVTDVISVWYYHLLWSARWFYFSLYVAIHPSPLCDRDSVDRRQLRKNHFHPDTLQCYVNASWLLLASLFLDCFQSHTTFHLPISSCAEQTSVTNHLFSRVSAGFTTSLCLNTPVRQHVSRALVSGAWQQLFSVFHPPWYWMLGLYAVFCSALKM